MDRRAFVGMVLAGAAAIATGLNKGEAATLVGKRQDGKSDDKDELRFRWERLDNSIASWWDGDLHRATEEEVLNDPQKTLISYRFPTVRLEAQRPRFPRCMDGIRSSSIWAFSRMIVPIL